MQDMWGAALGALPVVSKLCPTCGARNEAGRTTESISYYGYFTRAYSCRCAACGVEVHYHPIGEIRPDGVSA